MSDSWQSAVLAPVGPGLHECAVRAAEAVDLGTASMTGLMELHLRAVDAALMVGEPGVLVEQLRWERARLRTIAPHVSPEAVHEACCQVLSAHVEQPVLDEIDAVMRRAAELAADAESASVGSAPHDPRLTAYLDRVAAGDRPGALERAMSWADDVTDVTDVMLDLLQPAQIELGRAWEEGRLTVAQEHFGTAVAQQALAMLYPRLFKPREAGMRVVAVTAGADAHELGLRIVTDVLEGQGWRTTYLGTAVPDRDVVDRLTELDADLLALSATMPSQLAPLRELIRAVRAEPRCDRVRIIVGGRLISHAPAVVDWLGADAWATDARTVAEVCARLVGGADARA